MSGYRHPSWPPRAKTPWIATLCLSLLIGCGATPRAVPPLQLETLAEHPLTGRVWDTRAERFIEPSALLERVREARVVLLGEKHDNPDHHRIHGWVLRHIAGPDRPVLFEMLDTEDAAAIAAAGDAEAIRAAVNWDASGWPAFAMYAPVFEAIDARDGRALPAHPSRPAVRASMNAPLERYPAHFGLSEPLPQASGLGLRSEIERSHCGHANPQLVEGMFRAQRFKDAYMADQLRQALSSAPRVALVAGNGHVRRDVGIPFYLERAVVSVGVLEVSPALESPPASAAERFDYVWFTPRVDLEDPCVKFARQLKRIKAMRAPAQPGSAPGSQPGSAPGSQPGSAPGSQPGSAPASQPGSAPASQPGSAPAPPLSGDAMRLINPAG